MASIKEIKKETTGSRLKNLIRSRGFSQKEFAKILGVTEQSVSLYVRDKLQMSPAVLEKAATILNTSIDYILLNSNDDIPEQYSSLAKSSQFPEKIKQYNQQYFRCAHALRMLKAQGVQVVSTLKIRDESYVLNDKDIWMDKNGVEQDEDFLFDQVRKHYSASSCTHEVSFLGNVITMSEEEYITWLLSVWNSNRILLQSKFNVSGNITTTFTDTYISAALKGEGDFMYSE